MITDYEDSRIVGVLGGMGPAATADFYLKLIRLTPAKTDRDHLRVVIWADPTVPSRQDALLSGGEDPTPWLEKGVDALIGCGAEIIVSPCNTAHVFLPKILVGKPIQFISIIDQAIEVARCNNHTGHIGLMATDGALASGIYQDALERVGLSVRVPEAAVQRSLVNVIEAVKAGSMGSAEMGIVKGVILHFRDLGINTVIAGCTELSALLDDSQLVQGVKVIDPALTLATETIKMAQMHELR